MKQIFRPKPIVRRVPLNTAALDEQTRSRRGLFSEWIITNALGGYASGTVGGFNTRRFHGWLIAALPSPHGRTMMVNRLRESFWLGEKQYVLDADDTIVDLPGEGENPTKDPVKPQTDPQAPYLEDFRLESGLPVWTFRIEDSVLEKRVCIVHHQNTTYLSYTMLEGSGRLEVQPAIHVRAHEDAVVGPPHDQYRFASVEQGFELCVSNDLPTLKFAWESEKSGFQMSSTQISNLRYRIEQSRGYDWRGTLWSPGSFTAELNAKQKACLTLSTEEWSSVASLTPDEAFRLELERRRKLLLAAPEAAREGFAAELVLAADQFLITPVGRRRDQVRAHAVGEEIRSVIAGYHWFTDWGRDTMISLEGLTLVTGRWNEAEFILRSFGTYIRKGLIPNMFPEGKTSGLYNTADATMWFFHALDRYLTYTSDMETLEQLLPKMIDIIDWHLRGTDFGIGVDPDDKLLRQGAVGYQLTWMDAKVDGWVVTPRRGKAVEINALWYNALRLAADWIDMIGSSNGEQSRLKDIAEEAYASFQRRFWNPELNCLYDVVDSPEEREGQFVEWHNDASIRPNQAIAISLKYPVLASEQWRPVLEIVRKQLLTPLGLRSLSPRDPNYKAKYDGDLRTRDAAYHQGTVWAWLIGPFCDAWLRAYPGDEETVSGFLAGFEKHMVEDGIGTISEIFDAEPPFIPRGCMAQAWSVAEVLRCKLLLTGKSNPRETAEQIRA